MKKVALTLATVAAATVFAPEASAVPVFARQTGMACSACHFQHFPLLNGFGRSFKASAFTLMGAQGKVEGEHLDIPDRLNMAVLTSTYYQRESGKTGVGTDNWGVPAYNGELSIFYGGRAAEYAGFLSELGAAGAASTGAAKMVFLFPVADARVGFSAYTGGQGASYSFELLNTGAADTHKMMGNAGPSKQHVAAAYAGSWLGTRTDATGVQVIANNSMGFVTIGQYAVAPPGGAPKANTLPLTYVRAAATMDVAGWDAAFGLQNFSGNQDAVTGATNGPVYAATVLDAQAQGELAGMSTGLYVTYGRAPANKNGNMMAGGWSTLVKGQTVGMSQNDLAASSFNAAATVEVIPHTYVSAGMRFATLDTSSVAGGSSKTDNAIMVGVAHSLAQNIELQANYTSQSGTAWDANTTATGKTAMTFLIETLF